MGNSKVAIYARVSTAEQANEGTSLEHQIQQLTKYCDAQGWDITGQYIDPGHTGKNGDRPGLKRLVADANLGTFSKVVVYKLDRLSRNLRLLPEIEERFKDDDIGLHSVKEALDTSKAIGRTVFQVLGLVGEWEREAIVERTKSGRLQRYREGKWAAGKPAYGYSYDRTTKKLVINEVEARVIRRIYEHYKDGKSLFAIADALNEDKVKTYRPNAKGWYATTVRNVLLNPMYKGELIVNRHKHIAQVSKADASQTITIEVPEIVSADTWQVVQNRLTSNKGLRPIGREKWLLQGMIICGLCGLRFRVDLRPRARYYSCRGRTKVAHVDGSPRCTSPRFRADWLEDKVWGKIEEMLNDPNKLEVLLEETINNLKSREEELRARIMPVDEQLTSIAEQKARLADDWVRQNMTNERFRELQSTLDKEEARLRSVRCSIDPAQIDELEQTSAVLRFWNRQLQSMAWNLESEDGQMVRTVDRPHEMVFKILGLEGEDISDALQFPATRREILHKLQLKVVVFPDRIELNTVFPMQVIECQKCNPT